MKSPLRVSSRVKLAEALGISRPTLYAFARLPDSPPARNGYWYVRDWRRFVTRKRGSVKTTEKEQLQLDLLRTRLEREQHCLSEARSSSYNEARAELLAQVEGVFGLIRTELFHLRVELSPQFEGLNARAIHRAWKDGERRVFERVCKELAKRIGGRALSEESSRPVENVVPLFNGNGDVRRSAREAAASI